MHLDVFNLVEFELINGRSTPIITGAQAENTYTNLKDNLPAMAIVYFFAEVIDKNAFEYQEDEELWNFLVGTLNDLNYKGDPCSYKLDFLKIKQLEFLNILGYAPNLKECVFCLGSELSGLELIAYNTQARGVICRACFLNGQEGIVVKNDDFLSNFVLGSIFESLAEKKIYSLKFINSMLELKQYNNF